MAERRYWLMKSEPNVYAIDDLERDGVTCWDGVRNYQARNFMREQMHEDDLVLYYHSNATPPGVVGIARISQEAYPDYTALDPRDAHYDPKATESDPIWWMVDVEFIEKFDRLVPLEELKARPELEGMLVTQRGQRLSVQPVTQEHFEIVAAMGRQSVGTASPHGG